MQSGDPTGTGKGGNSIWGSKFEDEFNQQLRVRWSRIRVQHRSFPPTTWSALCCCCFCCCCACVRAFRFVINGKQPEAGHERFAVLYYVRKATIA